MSAEGITDDLVRKVAEDLRARYDLDDEDMRALGARLAESASPRGAQNLEFAERFTDKHRETFDRLAKKTAACPAGSRPSRTTLTSPPSCAAPSGRAPRVPRAEPSAARREQASRVLADGALPRCQRLVLGPPDADTDAALVERVAEGSATHEDVVEWIRTRTRGAEDDPPQSS